MSERNFTTPTAPRSSSPAPDRFTPADQLPSHLYQYAVNDAVDLALDAGDISTLLGAHPCGCIDITVADPLYLKTPGVIVIFSDLMALELAVNGCVLPPTVTVERGDGRRAYIFKSLG